MSRTPAQTDALEQLWAINASETEAARARDERLLRENGWDVQVSAHDQQTDGSERWSRSSTEEPAAVLDLPRRRRRREQRTWMALRLVRCHLDRVHRDYLADRDSDDRIPPG